MPGFTELVQTLLTGVATGSMIAIGAVGLTLSYGVTRFINFAYGEFLTYGAFVAWGLITALSLPIPVGAVLAVVIVGLLGVGISESFFEPLRDRGPIPLLITSIGVSLALRYLLQAFVGSRGKTIQAPLIPPINAFGIYIAAIDVVIIVVAAVAMVGLYLMLRLTTLGKMMRATSSNRRLARVSGIRIDDVIRKTWFISAALGALAGVLLGLSIPPFRPTMGWRFLLVVFASVLLGGIGRPVGAMVGGVVIGVVMALGTAYLNPSYTLAYAFVVLVGILLFRPEGIVGGEDV
jgi:branched-subunit amino acid ABC-type transport system permease component